jgi:hypothetical protein
MKNLIVLGCIVLVAAGCSGADPGQLPPPHKQMTQAEIDAMPPQARASMQSAASHSQQMVQQNGVANGK